MRKNQEGSIKPTQNGTKFEKQTSLAEILKNNNYQITDYNPKDTHKNKIKTVSLNHQKTGYLCSQHAFPRFMKEQFNLNINKIISQTLLPDEAFFNIKTNTLHIFEKKYQTVQGSVDEKIQTGTFKLYEYQKIAKKAKISVTYSYILSKWFKNKRYQDIHEYNNNNNIHTFFEKIPLSSIELN